MPRASSDPFTSLEFADLERCLTPRKWLKISLCFLENRVSIRCIAVKQESIMPSTLANAVYLARLLYGKRQDESCQSSSYGCSGGLKDFSHGGCVRETKFLEVFETPSGNPILDRSSRGHRLSKCVLTTIERKGGVKHQSDRRLIYTDVRRAGSLGELVLRSQACRILPAAPSINAALGLLDRLRRMARDIYRTLFGVIAEAHTQGR